MTTITIENPGFSDEELSEFKVILENKLAGANKELDYLRDKISKCTSDPATDLKNLGFNIEQLISMRDRQSVFISKLEAALARIENKTYGICEATRKLIDKDRLRSVPHATLSIEAKHDRDVAKVEAAQKKERKKSVPKERSCRVCGCTQDNCQQCIEKTGEPCHWVEEDLCSACVPKPVEPVQQPIQDPIKEYNEKILKQKSNINDMNFFSQLNNLIPGADISIALKEKNGKYTMSLLPSVGNKTAFQPLVATGTPDELDEKFFELISKPLLETTAMLKNAEEHKKSVENEVKEKAAAAVKSKPADKKPDTKKATEKKPAGKKETAKSKKKESKKEEPKIGAPDLFATT